MISSMNVSKTILAKCLTLCKCHHINVNLRNLSTSIILWKKEDEFLDDTDWWQNVPVSTKVTPKVKEDLQASHKFTEEFDELDKRLSKQTSVSRGYSSDSYPSRDEYLEPDERRDGGNQHRLPGLGKRKHE